MPSDDKIDLEIYKLIVENVFDASDPTTMGSRVTQLLVSTMGVKGASIFVVNPGTESLEILATEGLSIGYVNKGPILVDKSIKLPSNLKPVIITDTNNSEHLQYPEKAKKEGIRSIVSLPVNLRGKIIGALRIYHSEPWEVSELELSYLRLLTLNIGMALRYFRLSSVVQCTKDTLDEIHPIWL
ncbi:MAG: GAF domain-containing protein [Proteobacteria bacterium]|nr:GAF domain-containing protein [Pseudomonadota bacterium]MBU1697085.1 GAF domain-containing protein [Pseudomonadota bacterium]